MQKFATLLLVTAAIAVSGCASTIDRLETVGKRPNMSSVANPQTAPDYKPLSWPLPDPEAQTIRSANSLWQPGARGFFRDQRAARVGDICASMSPSLIKPCWITAPTANAISKKRPQRPRYSAWKRSWTMIST